MVFIWNSFIEWIKILSIIGIQMHLESQNIKIYVCIDEIDVRTFEYVYQNILIIYLFCKNGGSLKLWAWEENTAHCG